MPATVIVVDPDPRWPDQFAREESRIRGALDGRALAIEHVGSTSVPGLAAKPVIDIVLLVADSADEPAYLPALESVGYHFHLREPDWFEHRLLKAMEPSVNLHVFTIGCDEVARMLAFRDHLRGNPDDRTLYESTKRRLAAQPWDTVQDYADAKTDVVRDILTRAID
jgi:GrpB-like predicted nucleotidyltransferase (UPF0157 family)